MLQQELQIDGSNNDINGRVGTRYEGHPVPQPPACTVRSVPVAREVVQRLTFCSNPELIKHDGTTLDRNNDLVLMGQASGHTQGSHLWS